MLASDMDRAFQREADCVRSMPPRNSSTPVNTDTIKGEAMSDITQAQADAVLSAARESARETGTPMNIAVVEAGGKNGAIIGAIGVSGSTVENDHTIASAGAAAQR